MFVIYTGCGDAIHLLLTILPRFAPGSHQLLQPTNCYSTVVLALNNRFVVLQVSLSDFLTLFSARTHNGFFFSMRPGTLLLGAAVVAMGTSTIIGCLWPATNPDNIPTTGLVVPLNVPGFPEYKLWPLWTWIYCIVWWWVQDAAKVGAYWVMRRFNIFEINTARLVNVRGAQTFGENPMARASAGMVEGKLLEMKVDRALDSVNRVARQSNDPNLRRASQDLALVRNSVKLARASLGSTGAGGDAQAAAEVRKIQQTVANIESAIEATPPGERSEIQANLEDFKKTANKLAQVEKLARQSL